jgi:hypothetical protein
VEIGADERTKHGVGNRLFCLFTRQWRERPPGLDGMRGTRCGSRVTSVSIWELERAHVFRDKPDHVRVNGLHRV